MGFPSVNVDVELDLVASCTREEFESKARRPSLDGKREARRAGIPSGQIGEALACLDCVHKIAAGLPDTVPNKLALVARPEVREWIKDQLGLGENAAPRDEDPKPRKRAAKKD